MAGSYQDFYTHLRETGVAKTSHYQVSIPRFPKGLQDRFAGYDRLLALRCESAELPGRQLVTNDSRIYGPVYKTPYQSLYQDITLNFLETGDFFIRDFFEAWMNGIFNSLTNMLNFPRNYRTDISITQFDMFSTIHKPNDKSGNFEGGKGLDDIATWHVLEAFPSSVNQMPLAYAEDGLHRVSVTISYEYYIMSKPDKPKPQLAASPEVAPGGSGRT